MKSALLVVDIQNDFLPGGALAVKDGDKIIPLVNKLLELNFDLIVATKDWHPKNHGSFALVHNKNPGQKIKLKGSDQILWPVHCVENTFGSEFSSLLNTTKFDKIFFKGTDKNIDSYSAFFDNGHQKSTGLGDYFKDKNITSIYLAGLTTDYCVKYSALDAKELGFEVYVIIDACRPVNLNPRDGTLAIEEMKSRGVKVMAIAEIVTKFG